MDCRLIAGTLTSTGHELTTGADGAATDTENEQLPVLPAPSDALHTTVVDPTGKSYGDEALQLGPDVTPTLSELGAVQPKR